MIIKFANLLVTILLAISCNSKNNIKERTAIEDQSIETQIASLKTSMTHYMKAAQPIYTEKDIEKCAQILQAYNIEMANSKSKEAGMQIVKTTILALNELNESCGGELIETGEREAIAAIIITGGYNKGFNSMDEDITEEWENGNELHSSFPKMDL